MLVGLVVCRLGVSGVCLLVGVTGLDLDLVGCTTADLDVQQSGVYVPQLESRVTLDTVEARADARLQCLKKSYGGGWCGFCGEKKRRPLVRCGSVAKSE